MKFLPGDTDIFLDPITGRLASENSFPCLTYGYIWEGNSADLAKASPTLLDIKIDINSIFNTSFIVKNKTPLFPNAQGLSALDNGLMRNIGGTIEISKTITLGELPALEHHYIWQGNTDNRPEPKMIKIAPIDARYIIQQPDNQLTHAQALSDLVGLVPRILKATTEGVIEVAIRDEDYATKETLEKIKAETEAFKEEAQTAAEEASASAEEASASATEASSSAIEASASAAEATVAAGEATAAAATASGAATAAGISAAAAAVSAIGAAASASSASSSASDADHASSNAEESATKAENALDTLLNKNLVLNGSVYGAGLIKNAITTYFAENPILPGKASVTIPVGTTNERPQNPVIGMMRIVID